MDELDLRLEEWASAELKSLAGAFSHALILFCKGKALKIVLTNKEGEGFEAWRAPVNKYEPTSKASVVGKLAENLRTPFDGDLLDAIATSERKIMIYEAQSREKISDSLKIGCVIVGMGHNSMKEHLLMSATMCDSWDEFFLREIESIKHARKTITAPTPMELMHFKGNCHKCGRTLRKNVGIRAMEGQRSLNVHNVERNIMDSVGYGPTHHHTKIHRKEDGKETEKESAREPRKVESSKVEKAGTMEKEKVKERRDNVSTKSQNHQRNSEQVDLGNSGLNNLGTQKPTLRVGVTMFGTLQIQILRLQEPKNFSVRLSVILRLSNFGSVKHIESFQHDRLDPSQRTIILLFLLITLHYVGIWSTKIHYWDVRTAQGKRILCTLDETRKPMGNH